MCWAQTSTRWLTGLSAKRLGRSTTRLFSRRLRRSQRKSKPRSAISIRRRVYGARTRPTLKYFLWVKTQEFPSCGTTNDLFPGYLLAEATRHPKHVLACSTCSVLMELDYQPTAEEPATCPNCGGRVQREGPAKHNKIRCRGCQDEFR